MLVQQLLECLQSGVRKIVNLTIDLTTKPNLQHHLAGGRRIHDVERLGTLIRQPLFEIHHVSNADSGKDGRDSPAISKSFGSESHLQRLCSTLHAYFRLFTKPNLSEKFHRILQGLGLAAVDVQKHVAGFDSHSFSKSFR